MNGRTQWTVGCALTAMSLVSGCAATRASSALNRQVRDEVVEFLMNWNEALAAQDADAIRAMYAHGGAGFAWFEDGALRYDSPDAIIEALRQFPPGTRIRTELAEVEVTPLSRNVAYASAGFSTRIEMTSGPFEFDGVFTALLAREAGEWVMTRGHTSSRRDDDSRGDAASD